MNLRNKPRMGITGGSTDPAIPTNQTTHPGDNIAGPNNRPESFRCGYPGCGREFATKRGVGSHERQAHPDWRDQQLAQIKHKKAPWSEEEENLLARREAELTLLKTRFMNQALTKDFKDRSLDAIKSHRRGKAYREKVERCLAEMGNVSSDGDESDDNDGTNNLPSKDGRDERVRMGSGILSPDPVPGPGPRADFGAGAGLGLGPGDGRGSGPGPGPGPASCRSPCPGPGPGPAPRPDPEKENKGLLLNKIEEPLAMNLDYQTGRLMALSRRMRHVSLKRTFEEFTIYLEDVFRKPAAPPHQGRVESEGGRPPVKKKKRDEKYAKTQDLWRKDPAYCIDWILNEEREGTVSPPIGTMVPFWEHIMTGGVEGVMPENETEDPVKHELWAPITWQEIKKCTPGLKTAPGPDGLRAKVLREVPLEVLQRIFNIFMFLEKIPAYLLESYTSLIPKKSNATDPGDYRPITVSSVLIRTFHKVLASRLLQQVEVDKRQRAFLRMDGCAENVFVLDTILKYHQQAYKSLYMASIDVAKAFDSVSHAALLQTLKIKGLPAPMLRYVESIYENSYTKLRCAGWSSNSIWPTQGVKQGDPLSPMMFILTMDRMLSKLPKDIGCAVGETRVNSIAFADDVVLFASTAQGLQRLLDVATAFLGKCGLIINAKKSLSISLRPVPHVKKTIVDANCTFVISGNIIPPLKRTGQWTYLGVPFTPEGRVGCDPTKVFGAKLGKISKAPLKPQQKVFALRVFLLPSVIHLLTLGATYIGTLNKMDRLVRSHVRNWLKLPHDTPNAYIHAAVCDGGMGMTSYRWSIPMLRLRRLRHLFASAADPLNAPSGYLEGECIKATKRSWDGTKYILNARDLRTKMSKALYGTVDGMALRDSGKVKQQHAWVAAPTRFLTGRDYVGACKSRINALPTRSRTTRGQRQDRLCRAGCLQPETLNHIQQQCHRTHGARIQRHDAVVKYIGRSLTRDGYDVNYEPRLSTNVGLRKPDIVAVMGCTAVIIDAQVVGEQSNLSRAHRSKREYYEENRDVTSRIKEKWGVNDTLFSTATLSCRGIWSSQSAGELLRLGAIRKRDLSVLSSRVLIGGIAAWNMFNRATNIMRSAPGTKIRRHIRQGIG